MKYIVYCRRSSDESDNKQLQSLETQERLILECVRYHHLSIIDTFRESRSAKIEDNRPLFSEMIRKIRNGEANGILVAHVDRLSRNGMESAIIMKLLESGQLQEIRTPTRIFRSVSDMLYIDFDFVFAAHYSRNLSIRVKEGNATKLRKGERPGKAPIGYINKGAKIYPNPKQAPFIQRMYSLFSTGNYSLSQLTKQLYEEGFRSPYGNKIAKSNIHRHLRNPIYYGFIKYGNFLGKGIHEPLVSKKTWDNVQEILDGHNKPRYQKHDFLFKKYATCAICSCRLTATLAKKKYPYYYCTNGKKICEEHKKYISEEKMQNLFSEKLQDITIDAELLELSFELYKEDLKKSSQKSVSQKDLLLGEIEKITKKISRLIDMRLDGSIDENIFKGKHDVLIKEKTNLEISFSQVKDEDPTVTLELLEEYKKRSYEMVKMFSEGNFSVKRELMNSVLSNFTMRNQKVSSIQYKMPYALNVNVGKNPDLETLLPCRDSNPNKRIQIPLSYH